MNVQYVSFAFFGAGMVVEEEADIAKDLESNDDKVKVDRKSVV